MAGEQNKAEQNAVKSEKEKKRRNGSRMISLGTQIQVFTAVFFLLLFCILLVNLLLSVSFYHRRQNEQLTEALEEKADGMESAAEMLQNAVETIYSDDTSFTSLSTYQAAGKQWTEAYRVRTTMEQQIRVHRGLSSLVIYYESYQKRLYCVRDGEDEETVQRFADRTAQEMTLLGSQGHANTHPQLWHAVLYREGERAYFGIFMQKNLAAVGGFVCLEDIVGDAGNWAILQQEQWYGLSGDSAEAVTSLSEGTTRIGNRRYFCASIPTMDLTLTEIVPDAVSLYVAPGHVLFAILLACLVPMAVSLNRLIRKKLVLPLGDMAHAVQSINEGEWRANFQVESRVLEIENVKQAIQTLLQEIEHYKIRVYEDEINAQRTQLQYLRLRLAPHFYTNCLKNAYCMLELGEYENAGTFLLCMSRHIRYLLQPDGQPITLGEEADFVRNYIEMERFVSASPIALEIHIDEGCENARVPILILQTFAENAVKYATREAGGELRIGIFVTTVESEESTYLDIGVHDNGPGYPEELLPMFNHLSMEEESHLGGIKNLLSRLRLIWKERANWYFHNDNGAACELIVPMEKDAL